jgi:hypothetical protein
MPSKKKMQGKDKTDSKHSRPKSAIENSNLAVQQQPHPATIIQRTGLNPNSLTAEEAQQLQRTLGNRAVGRLLTQTPRQGKMPIQREVDTSSSPYLPKYEEDEVPGWKDDVGVPDWAKEEFTTGKSDKHSSPSLPEYGKNEIPGWKDDVGIPDWAKENYKRESKTAVICSITPEMQIGSVYFDDGSRIRTTHSSGPQHAKHENQTTVRFNIDDTQAKAKYKKFISANKQYKKLNYRHWLTAMLKKATVNNLPSWATLVTDSNTAHDLGMGAPPENLKLFEIFKKVNGVGNHLSRGVAAKFATDKQTISVLENAISHIDKKGLTDPKARNIEFYNFVKSRLPKFADFLRRPDEVNE